jgi:hypothetical protein
MRHFARYQNLATVLIGACNMHWESAAYFVATSDDRLGGSEGDE